MLSQLEIAPRRGPRGRVLPVGLALGLAALAAACGPSRNLALEAAQRQYQQTRSDPAVVEHAGAELAQAGQSLERAEAAFAKGDDTETKHFVRLTETGLQRAREVARAGQAGAENQVVSREIERVEEELAALQARVTEQGIVLTLSDVFFEVDRAELRPEGMHNLVQLAAFLNAHPDRVLAIEGHTDSTGTDAYNQQLSERRAETVRAFLATQGVAPGRVFAQGFGERFPVASNASSAGRAMNRRVEMLVLHPGETVRLSSVPIVRSYQRTTTTVTR